MNKRTNNTKKRLRNFIFLSTFTLIISVAIFAYGAINGQILPNDYNEPFIFNVDNLDDNEWELTLVNKWNPISKEENIELIELSNGEMVDERIYPDLQQMFDDARNSGVYMTVVSGYRTNEKQQSIYNNKLKEYKAQFMTDKKAKEETEHWVALPGTSEHELGLAVDINADGIQSAGQEVYSWLAQNAHKYGFIYRYPEDKIHITGISNEPWHYRYVGKEAATEMFENGMVLEEYVGEYQKK
ncbi:hypothetical protein GCM10012290_05560 [Halolactibacillus alkaliphilus]|uniref:D-alanyl-D-alanine carboxypeptidase-like core domain-containing protein n=1 Tax=Halolactibacillus alkaliphilus TaxID=442899 RepID=A0A511X046_9BACI|nr:hypothetical protein HAL01_07540 [Halolactibacillus alkaliphilus]GGN66180.1 hypothetical protein GCM10012290_05560 [Halolactibacillus alkaliphilus]SFO67272.1 D-alanyl-D-alanine carboxypeptidase [Halolactibacillus alkaliphilus]